MAAGGGSPTSQAAARPLRADAAANRARILEVAEMVFGTEGVHVPVDEIALRAGVGVGTVYRHFPTKEDLVTAVVLAHFEELLASAEALAEADDPGAALETFLYQLADTAATKRDLADSLSSVGVDIKDRAGDTFDRLHRSVEVLLGRAQAAGAIRADVNSDDLVALISGTCMAASRNEASGPLTRRLLTVVIDGLRAPAEHPG